MISYRCSVNFIDIPELFPRSLLQDCRWRLTSLLLNDVYARPSWNPLIEISLISENNLADMAIQWLDVRLKATIVVYKNIHYRPKYLRVLRKRQIRLCSPADVTAWHERAHTLQHCTSTKDHAGSSREQLDRQDAVSQEGEHTLFTDEGAAGLAGAIQMHKIGNQERQSSGNVNKKGKALG